MAVFVTKCKFNFVLDGFSSKISLYISGRTSHQPQPKGMGQRRERLTTF
jgi:hypothetical protein